MYPDHEFDPITPEEEAQRAQEAEFARRVRREVLRIERGEAEEEIRADLEREAAEKGRSRGARTQGAPPQGQHLLAAFLGHDPRTRRRIEILPLHALDRGHVLPEHRRHVHGAAPRHEILAALPRGPDAARALDAPSGAAFPPYDPLGHPRRLRRRGIDLYDPVVPGEILDD